MTLKKYPITQLTSLAIENIDPTTAAPVEGAGGLYLASMTTAQSRKAFPTTGNQDSKSNGMLFYNTTGKYVSTVVDTHFVEVVTRPENGSLQLKQVPAANAATFENDISNQVVGTMYIRLSAEGADESVGRIYAGTAATPAWKTITTIV